MWVKIVTRMNLNVFQFKVLVIPSMQDNHKSLFVVLGLQNVLNVVKTWVIVIIHALSTWKLESKSWIRALFLLLQTRSGFLWTCFIVHTLNKKMTKLWIRLVHEWCLWDGQKVRSLDISSTLFLSLLLNIYVPIYLLHQYKFSQHHMIVALVLFAMCIASLDWRISMFPRETLTTNFMTYLIATNNSRLKVVISTI